MALIKRLAILGAAAGGTAFFLKQRQQGAPGSPAGGDSSASPSATTASPSATTASPSATPSPPATAADTAAQSTRISNAVVPDTSADATVREQEQAAAAEAGSIGGEPETPQGETGLAADPAMQPVVEASGEEPETLEETDRDLGSGRERLG